MDYLKIIKRAAEITWVHKSTWLFGFLAALFQGGGGRFNYNIGSENLDYEKISRGSERFIETLLTPFVILIVVILILVLIILSVFLGFLAKAALIGMVSDIEKEGSTNVNKGFSCGWSHWLFLFGINLSIWIPFAICAIIVAFLLFAPAIAGFILKQQILAIVFLILAILLLLVAIIPTAIGLSVVELLSERFRVIKRMGVFESISEGYRLIRSNLGEIFVFWLIMLLIGMGLGLVLLPVTLLLLAPAIAFIFINVFLAIALSIPGVLVLIFLGGLIQVFTSAAWTKAFLELTAQNQVESV
jgi:hypothetical protein